ncbi:MAG: epimerase, partial [Rhodoferax sp.]|nr:epimerase [Rhodoferax sp.]
LGELVLARGGNPPRFNPGRGARPHTSSGGRATAGRLLPVLAAKAELARIGRYYATESMLVLDTASGRYSADATPAHGSQTLGDFQADLLSGRTRMERGDHAVF